MFSKLRSKLRKKELESNESGSNKSSTSASSNSESNKSASEKSDSDKSSSSKSESHEFTSNKSESSPSVSHPEDVKRKVRDPYPKGIFFILGNEFCERFSFYGFRTILILYLSQELLYSDRTATVIYHSFIVVAYFSPILGALIADSWLGRYHTILYVSILYAMGNITISVGAVPMDVNTMRIVSILGLVIAGVGTGGIKPCVSAFGGDQFTDSQEEEREHFFSIFYFVINSGSTLSTFLTPILRADLQCFGEETCYAVAYGIPAILMLISLVLFVIGKRFYTIHPAQGSEFVDVFKCMFHALYRKATIKGGEKKSHWLEYADDRFDERKIHDVKTLLNVLFLYIPLPVFWSLFDQAGSKWVLQASSMDGEIIGGYHMKPDHTQLANPLMILIFIPVFDKLVYPAFSKLNLLKRPLERIVIGGFIVSMSFAVAAFIQLRIERDLPTFSKQGHSGLTIINNSPCRISITGFKNETLKPFEGKDIMNIPIGEKQQWRFVPSGCEAKPKQLDFVLTTIIQTMHLVAEDNIIKVDLGIDTKDKLKSGNPRFRVFFSTAYSFEKNDASSFKFVGTKTVYAKVDESLRPTRHGRTAYVETKPGEYQAYMPSGASTFETKPAGSMKFRNGGSYIIAFHQSKTKTSLFTYVMVKPNSISILFQFPQLIMITAGEIMFSITGLSFSYSQAAPSMKSVVQAAWLLTVAVGNVLTIILTETHPVKKQSSDYFMSAAIMAGAMTCFAVMSHFYIYVHYEAVRKGSEDSTSIGKKSSTSDGQKS